MHEQFANDFYRSVAWQKCRRAFVHAQAGLCERCLEKGLINPGTEVHHRIPLTPDNITDPSITLSWDNLMLLCKPCHQEIHRRMASGARRWRVDADGAIYT